MNYFRFSINTSNIIRKDAFLFGESPSRIVVSVESKNKDSFEKFMQSIDTDNWIALYIFFEISLIKELGFESDIKINNNDNYKKALSFNRNLLMENFVFARFFQKNILQTQILLLRHLLK